VIGATDWPGARLAVDDSARREALSAAACVMRDRAKSLLVNLCLRQSPNTLHATATWVWPGVVEVRLAHNGALVAQSVAGRPFHMAGDGVVSCAPRCYVPDIECMAALSSASRLLQSRERLPLAHLVVLLPSSVPRMKSLTAATAVWHWPGVVRLTVRDTGELIAQSLPGRPFDIDVTATGARA